MSARKVLKLGDPLLRKPCVDVTEDEVSTKEFKSLIKDMFATMDFANGIGLAAPQIGVLKKIVVIGAEEKEEGESNSNRMIRQIIINPKITPIDPPEEGKGYWEGCLSVPEMRGYVERPKKIHMEWYDEKWNFHSDTIDGFRAIVYQHECDHLNGVLYVDRLKDTKKFGFIDSIIEDEKEKKFD